MGYQTHFDGAFKLDKPLTAKQVNTLRAFASDRHEGGDFPGYYCQWVASADGDAIIWNEDDSFRDYVQWLEYLIAKFIKPWGRLLNGVVDWEGEEPGDLGKIHVKDNVVRAVDAVVTHPKPKW